MLTQVVQRWRDRRGSYRPVGETIQVSAYEVAEMARDADAKRFVLAHHYAGSYPAAIHRFGLYRSAEFVGVAVFSVPANDRTLACLPGSPRDHAELGRFILLDDVPSNGETWFLARCFERLRGRVAGVVSFSDPMRRVDGSGHEVFKGHIGNIYQASNATYLGRSKAGVLRLLPDGSCVHGRALAKIRSRDRGWQHSSALLERSGAAPLCDWDDPRAWLAMWLPRLTRLVRHPGNHKYVFAVDKRLRRTLPPSLPYPKFSEET